MIDVEEEANTTTKTKPAKNQTKRKPKAKAKQTWIQKEKKSNEITTECDMDWTSNAAPTSPMDERPYAPDLSTIEENEEDSVDNSEAHEDEEIVSNSVVDEDGDSSRDLNSASDSEIEDEDIKFNPGPLGSKFLDIGEIITILSGPHTVREHVPVERKDGN
jgi:hypothetical protein